MRIRLLILLSLLSFAVPGVAAPGDDKDGPPEFKRLKFRGIGPSVGGRVSRACGVAGDPLTYYVASAGGGLWRSGDGGVTFKPVFDEQPISSLGSLAVAPSDPNVVYVGSGEANIRGNVQPGNGIYKSTDAGKTWKHVWKQDGQIGTLIVHPTNADIAFAAVLGHAFGPNEERGVYRTVDGGKTWQRVLFKDRDTGASDVCFDPHNPRILFAGLWQVRRRPWELTSGGPGSGLYVSRDGGDTWTHLVPTPPPEAPDAGKEAPAGSKYADGLPEGVLGKITVAVAPSDASRVYAMIEADKGGLFRSDDGGDSWSLASDHHALRQRAWYFSTFTIHPQNPDVLFFPQVPLLKTTDAGKTLQRVKGPHHGDHHDLWIDPKNPNRMITSNDGGVDLSNDGGKSWFAPPLPLCQFYHVAADMRTPYHLMGTIQDIGTASGPSNSLENGGLRLSLWHNIGGGETGFCVPDPTDPHIVYAGEYGGYLSRYDDRTRQIESVGIYPFDPSGHDPANLRYRFQWTAPVLLSTHNPKVLYHGANVVFRTDDAGKTWKAISPDLTRNDKGKQKWSGGPITGDNTGVEVYDTVYALAESKILKGAHPLLWAGSDDGLVHVTRDGGLKWDNVTPPDMPEWATVVCIETSAFDGDAAYLVADAHRLDDNRPYLWKTTDVGKTWKRLDAGLPVDFLRVVREDPKRKGLLYLGCDRSLRFSTDDGQSWRRLKLNLPTVAVTDLVIKDDDLVVATNGRSLWILDDLTPLRAWTPTLADKPVHLYPARPVVRWRLASMLEEELQPGGGENAPYGAILHYSLKSRPKGELKLEVLDAKNVVLRTLSSKEEPDEPDELGEEPDEKDKKKGLPLDAGLHRVIWDLRHEGAKTVKNARVDSGDLKSGPLVTPGTYTIRLTVDGKTETTTLEVKPDPRVTLSLETLRKQETFALRLRDDLTRLTKTIEQVRAVRKQIQDRDELLKDDPKAEPLLKATKETLGKLDALEEKLHNPKAKVSYDILAQKGGAQLYSQLAFLFDLVKQADGEPNQGVREVYEEQTLVGKKLDQEWQTLLADDLTKLNEQAKKLDVPTLLLPTAK